MFTAISTSGGEMRIYMFILIGALVATAFIDLSATGNIAASVFIVNAQDSSFGGAEGPSVVVTFANDMQWHETGNTTLNNTGSKAIDVLVRAGDIKNTATGEIIDVTRNDGNFQISISGRWYYMPDGDSRDDGKSDGVELCIAKNLTGGTGIDGIRFRVRSSSSQGTYVQYVSATIYGDDENSPCLAVGEYYAI